jgi:hypothetical protein
MGVALKWTDGWIVENLAKDWIFQTLISIYLDIALTKIQRNTLRSAGALSLEIL